MEELLSQIWDAVGDIFGGMSRALERSATSLFGSSNARYIKKLQPMVAAIAALEPKYQTMTDAELKEQTAKFRKRLSGGETLDDLLVEAYALCREAGRRFLGLRHYDVQMMGGIVLHRGNIAEMVTGEGKTLVATLPAYLNALEGKGVHVVTVNDYLARRDMEWMGRLYMSLGLTVDAIQNQMDAAERQKAYACDITYGTNNEFGFDYLRDNMRDAARDDDRFDKHRQQVQGPLELRHHRRGRQHPHRRGPHAADHLRSGPRRRDPLRQGRSHRAAVEEGPALRGQGEGAHGPPHRRGRPRSRAVGGRGELLHGRHTWSGRT